jgi:NADH-quinone oxidoreductase subunit M
VSFPWLTTIGAVPLIGALLVFALPTGRALLAKQLALAISLVPFALTVAMAFRFDNDAAEQFQFTEKHVWIEQFGISYSLGVDGISLLLIALSTILVPLVIIASWNDPEATGRGSAKEFFGLILLLEVTMIGVFAATDVFLFYVFFEALLIPSYFLIGRFGGPQRSYAAVKFLLYSLFGGLIMLVALIGLYIASVDELGTGTFDFSTLIGLNLDPATEKMLFLGFFLAFAIKAPMWPVHTWLPDAAAEARPGVAVLLVSVLDKVGTFGMIRLCLPLFPDASQYFAPLVIVLAVISIIYGALLAIGQSDMMRLIAYTSISHFGFIVLGIFAFTTQGQSGATLYMVNHGFTTAALFLVIGFLVARRGSRRIADYGGVQKVAPMLAGAFLVAGLSSLALPGLSSFISEFLVLVGTFTRYPIAAGIATFGIVLAALYILLMYQRTMTGPVREGVENIGDLKGREIAALSPLLAVILVLGFVPQPLLNVINPAIERTMEQIGQTDPEPDVAPVADTEAVEGDEEQADTVDEDASSTDEAPAGAETEGATP